MKYLALLLITMISLATSCQKENPKTPDNWHKDVFRCKVNGKDWIPKCVSDPLFGCNAVDCQYYFDNKGFEIGAVRRIPLDSIQESIGLFARPILIGNNLTIFPAENNFVNMKNKSGCRFYTINPNLSYTIMIFEIDTVKFLIKGAFEFSAINNCQDTVRITDGFFHVNFRF